LIAALPDAAMHSEVIGLHVEREQRRGALLALAALGVLAFVLLVRFDTTMSMVTIWWRSETFAHGFLVIPIVAWLVWRIHPALSAVPSAPDWRAVPVLVVLTLAGWLAGRVNAVSVTQFAMVATVPVCIWALLGPGILRRLAFPLFYLFLAVPFGEFLMPWMIDRTADFTVFAIRLSGVPIFREGNMFQIPSGRWSVVEACSGLRYLIASGMVGVLFAYFYFRSWRRRLAFVAAALIVPIIANWMRAYGIVMLGHLSDNRLAVGVDHLIYGWLFFGIVIAILFAVGVRWREDGTPADDEPGATRRVGVAPVAPWPRRGWLTACVVAVLVVAGGWLAATPATEAGTVAEARLAPLPALDGWQAARPVIQWQPAIAGASSSLRQGFVDRDAAVVLDVRHFRDRGVKAISSTNQVVQPSDLRYSIEQRDTVRPAPLALEVRRGVVIGAGERVAFYQWFWVDGHSTASWMAASLYQVRAVLAGRSDAVAWVVVSAPAREQDVWAPLDRFVAVYGDRIEAMLRATGAPN
jgi:exosortase A